MQLMREQEFYKRPGIAETIDWACALMSLEIEELDAETVNATIGCILKYKGDVDKMFDLDLEAFLHQVAEATNRDATATAMTG